MCRRYRCIGGSGTGAQLQDVATLSHDTADANGYIDEIFNKEQVEQNLAFTQEVGQVSKGVVQDVLQYEAATMTDSQQAKLKETPAYQQASAAQQKAMLDAVSNEVESEYGIGGTYTILGDAISGALVGLSGGDLTQAAAGALAPYLCAPGMARSALTGAVPGPWWSRGDLEVKVLCTPGKGKC